MSPEQLLEFNQMKEQVKAIDNGFRNLAQIDPQYAQVIFDIAKRLKLEELSNVNVSSPSDEAVIKYDSATDKWIEGVDNTV